MCAHKTETTPVSGGGRKKVRARRIKRGSEGVRGRGKEGGKGERRSEDGRERGREGREKMKG